MPQPQIDGEPCVLIRFYGSEQIVVLQPIPYEREGVDEESFATLPPGVIRTKPPHLTQRKYTAEEYQRWQNTCYTTDSAMTFYAENIPPESSETTTRGKFFLKVSSCLDKSPAGTELMRKLREEALIYKDHLSSVQGEAVPLHYGVWWGVTEWGSCIAVSIMQWGGLPYFTNLGRRDDSVEAKEAVLEAYRTLHMKAKVEHERTSAASHVFHVLYNEDLKRAFIVDFEYADFNHKCRLRMPLKAYESMPPAWIFGCPELLRAIRSLGMIAWSKSYQDDPEVLHYINEYNREYCRLEDSYLKKRGHTH